LDFPKVSEGIYEISGDFNEKNARGDIFDIGGSKTITGQQPTANTYKASSTYASPTAKIISEGKYI
jgi:hypothetical protein